MSYVRCVDCDIVFNSDNDPDCFCDIGDLTPLGYVNAVILCEDCRNNREAEQDKQDEMRARWELEAEKNQ